MSAQVVSDRKNIDSASIALTPDDQVYFRKYSEVGGAELAVYREPKSGDYVLSVDSDAKNIAVFKISKEKFESVRDLKLNLDHDSLESASNLVELYKAAGYQEVENSSKYKFIPVENLLEQNVEDDSGLVAVGLESQRDLDDLNHVGFSSATSQIANEFANAEAIVVDNDVTDPNQVNNIRVGGVERGGSGYRYIPVRREVDQPDDIDPETGDPKIRAIAPIAAIGKGYGEKQDLYLVKDPLLAPKKIEPRQKQFAMSDPAIYREAVYGMSAGISAYRFTHYYDAAQNAFIQAGRRSDQAVNDLDIPTASKVLEAYNSRKSWAKDFSDFLSAVEYLNDMARDKGVIDAAKATSDNSGETFTSYGVICKENLVQVCKDTYARAGFFEKRALYNAMLVVGGQSLVDQVK